MALEIQDMFYGTSSTREDIRKTHKKNKKLKLLNFLICLEQHQFMSQNIENNCLWVLDKFLV